MYPLVKLTTQHEEPIYLNIKYMISLKEGPLLTINKNDVKSTQINMGDLTHVLVMGDLESVTTSIYDQIKHDKT